MNAFYVICGLGVLSLIAEIVNLKKYLIYFLVVGVLVAAGLAVQDFNNPLRYFSEMLMFDNVAISFTTLLCCITALWFCLSSDYFHDESHITDQAALILFSLAGAILLTSYNNMAVLFLGIEILSICMYVLAGSKKENIFSNEAAFKYFLMGSFATGFLLMGIALIYGATGSFNLTRITELAFVDGALLPRFFHAGILMILVGLAFKISAVPFHFWAPDVYEGSPTAVTAYMSTVVKIAAFVTFFRIFLTVFSPMDSTWILPVRVIAVLTLVLPNIAAVLQSNVKRMLAYSSIGHAGFILIGFSGSGRHSISVIFVYLTGYAAASLLSFFVLSKIENSGAGTSVDSFNGLFKKNSLLAVAMAIALLSLAGIPPLAGFMGKYLIFSTILRANNLGLVILGVLTSIVGVYFYFKVVIAMFLKEPDGISVSVSLFHKILLVLIIFLILAMGLSPESFWVL